MPRPAQQQILGKIERLKKKKKEFMYKIESINMELEELREMVRIKGSTVTEIYNYNRVNYICR